MSASFKAQLPCIAKTATLGWAGDDMAQLYIKFIRMRIDEMLPRRGWHVGILKEFYPRGKSLLGLNVNRGMEVCVRFRVPGDKSTFLPFHEVLCTTLHELAHCQISRHDKSFWNLYYELVKECEQVEVSMVAKGIPLYPPAAPSAQPAPPSAPLGRKQVAGGKRASTIQTVTGSSDSVGHRLGGTAGVKKKTFTGVGHRLGGENRLSRADVLQPGALRRVLAEAAEERFRLNHGMECGLVIGSSELAGMEETFGVTNYSESEEEDPDEPVLRDLFAGDGQVWQSANPLGRSDAIMAFKRPRCDSCECLNESTFSPEKSDPKSNEPSTLHGSASDPYVILSDDDDP